MTARYISSSSLSYPKQTYVGCGGYQLRAIFQHTTGQKLMKKFPWFVGPHKLAALCKKYSLSSHKRNKGTIEHLREVIDHGGIPIILIGRGYNHKKPGFSRLKAIVRQHYISIRGYDDEKQIFYCYDSTVKHKNNDLPIGNQILSYSMVKRSWSRGGLGIYRRFCIEISE